MLRCLARIYVFALCCFSSISIFGQEPNETPPAESAILSTSTDQGSPFGESETGSLYEKYKVKDIEMMSVEELAFELSHRGLSTRGTKAELADRLLEAVGEKRAATVPDTPSDSQADEKKPDRTVTIESAGSASYFTLENDESHIRLSGGVSLLIEESSGANTHRIRAREIVFNQDNQVMTARGNVEYTLKNTSGDQRFEGEELTFDLNSSDAIFLDGVALSEQTIKGERLNFRVIGNLITRTSEDLILLDRASLTSSSWTPPAYTIVAKKIRILRPGEWVLEDAVLYLGRIPMFYFPFFYNPNDELVFHPVTGYKSVEGAFLQTTTYLLGRKPVTQQPFSLLQINSQAGDNYTLVPRGLWLERVRASENSTSSTDFIKLMADYYTKLGGLIGLQAAVSGQVLTQLKILGVIAFSNALYASSSGTSTIGFSGGEAITHVDGSRFGGLELPFRFAIDLNMALKFEGLSFSAQLPIYSDPSVSQDFMTRSEDIDWGKLVGISQEEIANTSTTTATSMQSLLTQMNLTFSASLAELQPFIQNVSISRLGLNWTWQARPWVAPPPEIALASQSAEKQFFVPGVLTAPDIGASLSGSLLEIPFPVLQLRPQNSATNATRNQTDEKLAHESESQDLQNLLAPWQTGTEEPKDNDPGTSRQTVQDNDILDQPAKFEGKASSATGSSAFSYKLSYNLSPNFSVQAGFPNFSINDPEDIAWDPQFWKIQDALTASVQSSLNLPLRLMTLNTTFNFRTQEQNLVYFSDSVTDSERTSFLLSAGQATGQNINQSSKASIFPLSFIESLSATSLDYGIDAVLYRRKFSALENDVAQFIEETPLWNKDFITIHYSGATFSFKEGLLNLILKGSVDLPPLDPKLNTSMDIKVGTYALTASTSFLEQSGELKPNPISLSLQLPFLTNVSFNQTLVYNPEDEEVTDYSARLNLWGLSSDITAKKAQAFDYDPASGWVPQSDSVFQISDIAINFSGSVNPPPFWKNRITTKVTGNIGYKQNLLQVTGSSLSYSLQWDFKMYQFLDISFSFNGENTRMYRYFPELSARLGVQEISFFEDFFRSFNFFNEEDRKASGFDMKSFGIKLTHYFGDWELVGEYKGSPVIKTATDGNQTLSWDSTLNITIGWKPIPEIKKTILVTNDELGFQ